MSDVDDRAVEEGRPEPEATEPETVTAKQETAETETAESEAAETETAEAADTVEPAARTDAVTKRPLAVLAGISAVLLVAAVAFGVLFARERADRERAERDLMGQTALAKQREVDLEAVRAQRAEIERKLATAEAQLLSPEAKLAISNCVKAYAMLEKVMEQTDRTGVGAGAVEFAVPVGDPPSKVCVAAEPHLAKLA